jgi:tRNA pseudouridine55 synthase
MDGLLVVNKPSGPTSHDVVARVRRVLRERRIGHTGTLDPTATGVLPLVVGRATRLARFLSASDKIYEATIRFGFATNSGDAAGLPTGPPYQGPPPTPEAIEEALDAFRGSFMQQPPAVSAKKIGGVRSYTLARQAARGADPELPAAAATATLPAPVRVTAHALDVLAHTPETVTLRVHCGAGFYVRSLAHDLGERLGIGGHLAALCRTASGGISIERAIALSTIESGAEGAAQAREALIPIEEMLPALPARRLTIEGVRHAVQGRDLAAFDFSEPLQPAAGIPGGANEESDRGTLCHVRLVGPGGMLVGIGQPSLIPGLLHPAVVLM